MNQPIIEIMKIRSIIDVITNSSSETFIISHPRTNRKELLNLLTLHRETLGESEEGSGMGGEISVGSLHDWLEDNLVFPETPRGYAYSCRIPYIPESLVVGIDWALVETIKNFREEFPEAYNIEESVMYPVWDEEGEKIIKLTEDYQEWISLKEPLRMHGKWAFENMDWWNYEKKE